MDGYAVLPTITVLLLLSGIHQMATVWSSQPPTSGAAAAAAVPLLLLLIMGGAKWSQGMLEWIIS